MPNLFLLLLVGVLAGILSGLFGIGGGLVIVPALTVAFGWAIHRAIGTSLGALLLPVGILGVLEYWKKGNVDLRASLLIAVGLTAGVLVGAKVALSLPPSTLRKIYGVFLLAVGTKFLLQK